MEFDQETYHQIDAYLNDSMSEAEKLLFEEQMESNESLKEEVALNKNIKISLKDEGWSLIAPTDSQKQEISKIREHQRNKEFINAKNAIKNSADEYFKKQEEFSSKKKPKTWIYYASAVAAIVAFIVAIQFNSANNDAQQLYAANSNWEKLPSLIVQSDNDELLVKGESFFKARSYKEAILAFTEVANRNEENAIVNPYIFSYLGASHLELGNYEEAITFFDKLQQSNTIDASRAYWYRALVYLKKEDMSMAQSELEFILKDEKNYNYKKAKELFDKIN